MGSAGGHQGRKVTVVSERNDDDHIFDSAATVRAREEFIAAMPTDKTTELTVEDAIQELRDMFPNERFRVEVSQRAQLNEDGEIKWLESYACILQLSRGLEGFYDAPTLEESLESVRKWKESQQ